LCAFELKSTNFFTKSLFPEEEEDCIYNLSSSSEGVEMFITRLINKLSLICSYDLNELSF
jgi:hypothetical protein